MCVGTPIFANNKKAFYGKGTNSHSAAASNMNLSEDKYWKYEYHWHIKKLVDNHYDQTGKDILKGIDKKKADKHVKALIKKEFSTPQGIYKWLKDVPDEWKHLQEIKDLKLKNYLFRKITGYTPKENALVLKKAQKRVDAVIERVKKIQWFKPQATISKKEISFTVDAALSLFHLPKAEVEFKYLNTKSARDAAWDAAWDAQAKRLRQMIEDGEWVGFDVDLAKAIAVNLKPS